MVVAVGGFLLVVVGFTCGWWWQVVLGYGGGELCCVWWGFVEGFFFFLVEVFGFGICWRTDDCGCSLWPVLGSWLVVTAGAVYLYIVGF